MSLNHTPSANRLHITLFGCRNSGKSSLMNLLTRQQSAVVSAVAGTTTDAVTKAMELAGIGAVTFTDTPGYDDHGTLGVLRIERTHKALAGCDVALVVCNEGINDLDREWIERLKGSNIPTILLLNKVDLLENPTPILAEMAREFSLEAIPVSALRGEDAATVYAAIVAAIPPDFDAPSIVRSVAKRGDSVLLVMPQDIQAPKGRLILPQVQTLRELLDLGAMVSCCTSDNIRQTLAQLVAPPQLIITDSQVFNTVYALKPAESKLTSFSVLMAQYKGDISTFVAGANAIERLTPTSRVLIAEACTHAPMSEDIGRVKLPRLLRKRIGEELTIDIVSGKDFPTQLTPYDLIIHCGGCMFNRKYMLSRIAQAKQEQTPITNYGIAMAYLGGIIDKIVW